MVINPINPIGHRAMIPSAGEKQVSKEFLTLFLSSVLKDALRIQNDGLLGKGNALGDLNDLFVEEIIAQLTEDDQFGLNELVYESMAKKPSSEKINKQ